MEKEDKKRLGLSLGLGGGVGAASGIGGFFGSRSYIANSMAKKDMADQANAVYDKYKNLKDKLNTAKKILQTDEKNTRTAMKNLSNRIDKLNNAMAPGYQKEVGIVTNAYDAYENKLNGILKKKQMVRKGFKSLHPDRKTELGWLNSSKKALVKSHKSAAGKKALLAAAIIGVGSGLGAGLFANYMMKD